MKKTVSAWDRQARPRLTAWSWLVMALAMAWSSTASASPPVSADVVVAQFDLNNDGIVDFDLRVTTWQFQGGTWKVQYWLMPRAGNAHLDPGSLLSPGALVPPQPSAPANWDPSAVNIGTYGGPPDPADVFTTNTDYYVGVRFAAVDGPHLGWLKLTHPSWFSVVGSASGWQPAVDTAIAVGQQPALLPPGPSAWATELPLSVDPRDAIDFLYRVRLWTNQTTGVVGLSARLAPMSGLQTLVSTGQLEGQPALFAAGLTQGTMIPKVPPTNTVWQAGTNEIVLLEQWRPPQTNVFLEAGPLAEQREIYVAVSEGNGYGAGWIRFGQGPKLIGAGFSAYWFPVAGEPSPQHGETQAGYLDINGDGLVDYTLRKTNYWRYAMGAGQLSGYDQLLIPVGDNEVLMDGNYVAVGVTNVSNPLTLPFHWASPEVVLAGVVVTSEGVQPYTAVNGPIACRFATAQGKVVGFLMPTAYSWDAGTTLTPVFTQPPASSQPTPQMYADWGYGRLTISWDAPLAGYTLEWSPTLSPPAWTVIGQAGPTWLAVPADAGNGFFRLRK